MRKKRKNRLINGLAPERCGTTYFPYFRTCKYPGKWINPIFHHTSSTSCHSGSGKSNLGMNIYNYIPIYMQRRIGSGYYDPIIQSVTEMSGCENRLFLILALCVSGRLIPLAESGGKRVRNQKKIEFRTPADRMRLFRPHPPADRMAQLNLSQPRSPIYDLFFTRSNTFYNTM